MVKAKQDEETYQAFKLADRNGDGAIDFDEFIKLFQVMKNEPFTGSSGFLYILEYEYEISDNHQISSFLKPERVCEDKFDYCKEYPHECGFQINPFDCPVTCCTNCDCSSFRKGLAGRRCTPCRKFGLKSFVLSN